MTIQSVAPNNEPKAHRRLTVTVNPATVTTGCSTDTQGPVVTLAKPAAGSSYPTPLLYPVHLEASASDATTGNNGVAFVEYKINYPGPEQVILGPVTSGSPWPYDWTESAVNAYLGATCARTLEVQAYAQDTCGNATYSAKTQVDVINTGTSCECPGAGCVHPEPEHRQRAGRAGRSGPGRRERGGGLPARRPQLHSPSGSRPGGNRVEATLVEARSAGTWRFELGGVPGFRPESLRVVAGRSPTARGGLGDLPAPGSARGARRVRLPDELKKGGAPSHPRLRAGGPSPSRARSRRRRPRGRRPR